jgi:phosphatidylinositol alpha-mannosyltransferase
MAAGTSIVCSDIHGYKGVVRRDRDALLVPPHEPKALAAAIGRLVSDDELRSRMALSGRLRAQEFSWERVTGKVEDYYGFVIRRLAAQGALPPGFHADIPLAGRASGAAAVAAIPGSATSAIVR